MAVRATTSGGGKPKAIYDVSFAGSVVVIGGASITDFMDDQNPIDVQDTDIRNIEWSCNGKMIKTIKPSAVIISVTVIPGSASDNKLRTIWKRGMCNEGAVDLGVADQPISCSITTGKSSVGNFTFTGGACVSGAAAITSNGQGKMGGNTYTFAFPKTE